MGRVADGWLPSMAYLPDGPEDFAEMNERIDEGGAGAGRGRARRSAMTTSAHGLRALSRALQQVHRALLDISRARHERAHERVYSRGELLRLVLTDEAFAWLQPLSRLIVDVDELAAARPAPTEAAAAAMRTRVERLVSPADGAFGARYTELLGSEPSVAMHHAELRAALRALPLPP